MFIVLDGNLDQGYRRLWWHVTERYLVLQWHIPEVLEFVKAHSSPGLYVAA